MSGDRVAPELVESSFTWQPLPGSMGVVVAFFVVTVALTIWAYQKEPIARLQRWLLVALRLVVFTLVTVLLAGPGFEETTRVREKPAVALLLDASASMAISDQGLPNESRLEAAKRLLGADDGIIARLRERAEVRLWRFGADVEAAEADQLPEFLAATSARDETTDLMGALRAAALSGGGRDPAAIVLCSDGWHNAESEPLRAADRLRTRGIPVHAIGFGGEPPRDIAVSAIDAPEVVLHGDAASVTVSISHTGFHGQTVTVRLSRNGTEVDRRVTLLLQPLTRVQFVEDTLAVGRHRYEVAIEAGAGIEERDTQNNVGSREVECIDDPIRVLAVEHLPRWEWRFLAHYAERDPRTRHAFKTALLSSDAKARDVERGLLPGLPGSAVAFAEFDLLILGDFDAKGLSSATQEAILDFVGSFSGAVLIMPGPLHGLGQYDKMPLAELLPVAAVGGGRGQRPSAIEPTAAGADHPAMMLLGSGDEALNRRVWSSLPPCLQRIEVAEIPQTAATTLLRERRAGGAGAPILTWRRYGNGLVAFLAVSDTWRWRSMDDGRLHERFWGQLVRWLGLPRLRARKQETRLVLSRHTARVGDLIEIEARIARSGRMPESILCLVAGTDGRSVDVALAPLSEQPGRYGGAWVAASPGQHGMSIRVGDHTFVENLVVAGPPRESDAVHLDRRRLQSICERSGGQFFLPAELDALLQRLPLEPEVVERERFRAAFDGWCALLPLLLVLASEWTIRKLNRMR